MSMNTVVWSNTQRHELCVIDVQVKTIISQFAYYFKTKNSKQQALLCILVFVTIHIRMFIVGETLQLYVVPVTIHSNTQKRVRNYLYRYQIYIFQLQFIWKMPAQTEIQKVFFLYEYMIIMNSRILQQHRLHPSLTQVNRCVADYTQFFDSMYNQQNNLE